MSMDGIGSIDKIDAIQSLVPLCKFSWIGEDYEGLNWTDEREKPTEAEIDAEVIRLEAEYDVQEYARNRADEYPSTGDQFDKIYRDGLTKWKSEMVDPVKTKWPKDNSGPV